MNTSKQTKVLQHICVVDEKKVMLLELP